MIQGESRLEGDIVNHGGWHAMQEECSTSTVRACKGDRGPCDREIGESLKVCNPLLEKVKRPSWRKSERGGETGVCNKGTSRDIRGDPPDKMLVDNHETHRKGEIDSVA